MSRAFGPFSFEPKLGVLLRNGEPLPLGRRGAVLLRTLLESGGRVVARDALIEAAWPGLAIEDSNLSVQIAKLRRLVGDDRIRTIERVGYQWVDPPGTTTGAMHGTRIDTARPRVAVVAFTDGGGDAPGFIDELTTALVPFHTLEVATTPETSRYTIRGTVRPDKDGVRVHAHLIDTEAGALLWTRAFDLDADAAIDEAAGAIAAAVESRIHIAEMRRHGATAPRQTEAYDLYLRGRARQLSSEVGDNAAAYAFHRAALELEPANPTILSAAAEAIHHRTAVGWPQLTNDDRAVGADLAQRVLETSDVDGVSLGLIGNALMTSGEPDWGLALSRRGAELNRNSPLALICAGLAELWADNLEASESILARATTIDPGDPTLRFIYETRARLALMRGEPAHGLELAHKALSISAKISQAYWSVIEAHDALGHRDRAERTYAAYRRIAPSATLASIEAGQPFAHPGRFAPALAAMRRAGMPDR